MKLENNVFIFILFLLLSSCEIKHHRIYTTRSPDRPYSLSYDIEDSYFDKYTVDNTKFILLVEDYSYETDWKNKDIAGGYLFMFIYTKQKDTVTYRLLNATIETSTSTKDLIYNPPIIGKLSNDPYRETYRPSKGYKCYSIVGGYYKFPCPKDMKYTMTLNIEIENEDGVTSIHEFKYFYILKKNDGFIRILA